MGELEPSDRRKIEDLLGRPLTEEELRPVASSSALPEVQRKVIRYLRNRSGILGMLYVRAVVSRIPFGEAKNVADDVDRDRTALTIIPWSLEAGVGRWRFSIARKAESDLEMARRCTALICDNCAPFGSVRTALFEQLPAAVLLDVTVQAESGEKTLPFAAMVTLSADSDGVSVVLELDVDIYAAVTWQFSDNTILAALNAPRLTQFLAMLRTSLHARFVASEGLLPVDEDGFVNRPFGAQVPQEGTVIDGKARAVIELALGRPLVADELLRVTRGEELSAAHRRVLNELAQRQVLYAMMYIRTLMAGVLIAEAFRIADGEKVDDK